MPKNQKNHGCPAGMQYLGVKGEISPGAEIRAEGKGPDLGDLRGRNPAEGLWG